MTGGGGGGTAEGGGAAGWAVNWAAAAEVTLNGSSPSCPAIKNKQQKARAKQRIAQAEQTQTKLEYTNRKVKREVLTNLTIWCT